MATYNSQLLKTRRHKLAEHYVDGTMSAILKRAIGESMHVFGRRVAPLQTNRHLPAHGSPSTSSNGLPVESATYPSVISYKFTAEEHKLLHKRRVNWESC